MFPKIAMAPATAPRTIKTRRKGLEPSEGCGGDGSGFEIVGSEGLAAVVEGVLKTGPAWLFGAACMGKGGCAAGVTSTLFAVTLERTATRCFVISSKQAQIAVSVTPLQLLLRCRIHARWPSMID